MKFNVFRALLTSKAKTETVDKFHRLEKDVAIIGLANSFLALSSFRSLPERAEFLYSKDCINMAINHTRTLALVLANPILLELDAKNIEHLWFLNTLSRVAEKGRK